MKIIDKYNLLTNKEIGLIKDIIDFWFSNYVGMLEIEIELGKKPVNGRRISLSDAQAALERAESDYERARERYRSLWKRCSITNDPDDGQAAQLAEIEMGQIGARARSLKELIDASRDGFCYPFMELLGEFIPDPSPKVILYMGGYRDPDSRYREMVPVFVHEMIHARNYFEGKGSRSVREIDEAMVEFATGVCLAAYSKITPDSDIFLARHRSHLLEKSGGVGEIACYGFGLYLMDNVTKKSRHTEKEWIESYAKVSASLDESLKEVKEAVKALYPFYPTGSEVSVMDLFERVIFPHGASTGVVSKPRKRKGHLLVIRRDGSTIWMGTAADTFVLAILEAGITRVYELRIPAFGAYLVDDRKNTNKTYAATQYYEPISGLYILRHSNTEGKKRNLERISSALDLGWTVEIV